jgi:hypothetical protein
MVDSNRHFAKTIFANIVSSNHQKGQRKIRTRRFWETKQVEETFAFLLFATKVLD